jgi:hypothetical protein
MHVLPDSARLADGGLSGLITAAGSGRGIGWGWKARVLQTGEQQHPGSVKTLSLSKLVPISESRVLT